MSIFSIRFNCFNCPLRNGNTSTVSAPSWLLEQPMNTGPQRPELAFESISCTCNAFIKRQTATTCIHKMAPIYVHVYGCSLPTSSSAILRRLLSRSRASTRSRRAASPAAPRPCCRGSEVLVDTYRWFSDIGHGTPTAGGNPCLRRLSLSAAALEVGTRGHSARRRRATCMEYAPHLRHQHTPRCQENRCDP